MIFPKLFKYTSKGQEQSWQIFTSGDCFWTEEGIHTITKSDPTVCTGKNIGKSNETTPEEQAILEAQARHQKKLDKGYNEVLTTEKKYFEPMLAHEFKKYEKLLFTVPTFIQPKLDGVRCYMDGKKLMTRTGNEIISCPHLQLNFFGLDGELYNHDLKKDFNKIISLIRQSKPTAEDFRASAQMIQYWVYDYPYYADKVFSERYRLLQGDYDNLYKFNPFIKLVPTYNVYNMTDILKYHEEFLEQGYEGSIIRLDLGAYENKRSKQLLKYKDFQDAEFKIVDITPGLGNRSNCAGRLICQIGEKTFGCSMTGTEEFMTQVLEDKDKIIGLEATVKFFQYTEDGIPRFPTLKNIIGYV